MPGFVAFVLIVSALPGAAVVQPVADMHATPTADSEVVSQAIYGKNVDVLEQRDGWGRVRTADNYTGWMTMAALRTDRSYATGGRVAEVQSLFAHLYRETDVVKHAPLLTVPFETRLEVIAEPPGKERWLQVRLPDDRTAWVQSGDVAFDVKPLSIAETLVFSKRFLGLPYTWGGTSSYGYDCSGFVQMLCRRRGADRSPRRPAASKMERGVARRSQGRRAGRSALLRQLEEGHAYGLLFGRRQVHQRHHARHAYHPHRRSERALLDALASRDQKIEMNCRSSAIRRRD